MNSVTEVRPNINNLKNVFQFVPFKLFNNFEKLVRSIQKKPIKNVVHPFHE